MIDLILAGSFAAVFYGSFKLGNKYKSLKEAFAALLEKVGSK